MIPEQNPFLNALPSTNLEAATRWRVRGPRIFSLSLSSYIVCVSSCTRVCTRDFHVCTCLSCTLMCVGTELFCVVLDRDETGIIMQSELHGDTSTDVSLFTTFPLIPFLETTTKTTTTNLVQLYHIKIAESRYTRRLRSYSIIILRMKVSKCSK